MKYRASLTIDDVTYNDVFFLKPGQNAVIDLPNDTLDYYIVECGVNDAVYCQVTANGSILTGRHDTAPGGSGEAEGGTSGRLNYATTTAAMDARPQVVYDNEVHDGAMRNLEITKRLYDTDGKTELRYDATDSTHDDTLFEFRLYLGNEFADPDDLPLANLYPYYVKNARNEYCRWEGNQFQPIKLNGNPITEYNTLKEYLSGLSSTEKESIVFITSTNGSISNIPAGYTVEVRDLIIGMQVYGGRAGRASTERVYEKGRRWVYEDGC